jgi:hypothetical protein
MSKHFESHCYLLLFSLLLSQPCYSKEYTQAEIERVENRAIANRERFKSWHVRVTHTDVVRDPSLSDPDRGDRRGRFVGMELFQSENGDFFREERKYLLNETTTNHVKAFGGKWIYRFGTDIARREDSSEDIAVLNMKGLDENANVVRPYDARTLGFVPGEIRATATDLRRYIGSQQRKDISMKDDVLNGEQCYKISYVNTRISTKNITSVWISPSRDHNPLKFEIIFPDLKKISTFNITVEKQRGYWFPSLIHTTMTVEGKKLNEHKTQIEVVSLNEKMDPNLFNEKGLGLPIGTLVLMDPEPFPDTFTWDGEKIVGLSGATIEPYEDTPRNYTVNDLLMAMGLALIFTYCLKKYFDMAKKE